MILVSPTEPQELRTLGRVSLIPERYGVDVLLAVRGRLVGIQRKTFPEDYLASLQDGRLQKELMQMRRLDVAVLCLEGRPAWDATGTLWARRYTQYQLHTALWSVSLVSGVYVDWTDSLAETCAMVFWLRKWLSKQRHVGLLRRPKARDTWGGRVRGEGQAVHILQGLPGMGPVRAQAILKHFGRVPLAWTCTQAELEQVEGIGPKTATALYKTLQGGDRDGV